MVVVIPQRRSVLHKSFSQIMWLVVDPTALPLVKLSLLIRNEGNSHAGSF